MTAVSYWQARVTGEVTTGPVATTITRMLAFFRKDRIVAPPGYNRWKVPLASVAIHLCIGSVYAWSIFNPPLTKLRGVAASAADDWTLDEVVWVFTVAIVFLGLSAAVAGKWLERVGPRVVGTVVGSVLGRRVPRRRARHPDASTLAALSGLRRDRRLRAGARVCLAGQHADPLVPRPPRHGGGHGHHGLRRRGHHRLAAQGVPDRVLLSSRPSTSEPSKKVTPVTEDGRRYAMVDGQKREVVVVVRAR